MRVKPFKRTAAASTVSLVDLPCCPFRLAVGCNVVLCAGEQDKRADIVIVSCPQCGHVCGAKFSDVMQTASAPRKWLPAQSLNHQIRHEPSVTTIAVWERMNGDEPMMKPY